MIYSIYLDKHNNKGRVRLLQVVTAFMGWATNVLQQKLQLDAIEYSGANL